MTILLTIILPVCRAEAPLFLNHAVQRSNVNMRVSLASLSSPLFFFFWFLDRVCRSVYVCVHVACVCACAHMCLMPPYMSEWVLVFQSTFWGCLRWESVKESEGRWVIAAWWQSWSTVKRLATPFYCLQCRDFVISSFIRECAWLLNGSGKQSIHCIGKFTVIR